MGGWGVKDGLSVGPDELGGGLLGLDALGGLGEGVGDGVVELGELAEGEGLVAGGGDELRSQVGGGDLLVGEGLGGEKFEVEGRSPATEFDEDGINAIDGGSTHESDDANGGLGVRYDQIWTLLRHG